MRRNADIEVDDLHRAALFSVPETTAPADDEGNGFSRRSISNL